MRTSSMVRLSLITAILTVAGCMPDNSSNESGQTTGENVVIEGTSVQSDNVSGAGGASVETDTMTTPEAPPKCERRGLSSPDKVVKRIANGLEYITEQTEESGTKDRLKITVFQSQDFIGPTAPGDYLLDGVNYRDCGLCAVIYAGIDPENPREWQKTFYADRGTINFSDLEDGKLKGAFKDVVFYEVEINQADNTSTRVEGGETWCFDEFAFEGETENPGGGGQDNGPTSPGGGQPPAAMCNSNGQAACVGDPVSDFELLNCYTGEMVSMHGHFEGQKAGWFVFTTEWCPGCSSWIPQVVGAEQQAGERGLKVAYILGENRQYAKPTLNQCKAYAMRYGVPEDSMFIDHDDTDSFRWTFAKLAPYVGAGGSFGLPFNAVINAETKEYVYADRGPNTNPINVVIENLLGL